MNRTSPATISTLVVGESRRAELEVTAMTPFPPNVGSESKQFVEGLMDGNPVSFVLREDGIRRDGGYSAAWKRYRQSGLPVAPQLLKRVADGKLLVSDVKADGSEVYGKTLGYWDPTSEFEEHRVRFRPRPAIDSIFLKHIRNGELERMKQKAMQLGELATRHRILLPSDDTFETIVHPDGSWDLILLDLGLARPRPQPTTDRIRMQGQQEFLVNNNESCVESFGRWMGEVITKLSTHQLRP